MSLKRAIDNLKRGPPPRDFILNGAGEGGMEETSGGGVDCDRNLRVSYACYYASKKCRRLARDLYTSELDQVGKWPSAVEERAILDYLEERDSQPTPWYPRPSSKTALLLPSTPVTSGRHSDSMKGNQIFEMAVSEMMVKLGESMAMTK